jgi:hypothetical protein
MQPGISEPVRGIPQSPRAVAPTVTQPTQTAPVIQQQFQERPQPQRQQVQERLQQVQPREQATQPEQRQLRPETASAPSVQLQRATPAAQPQVQGQSSPVPSKKKPEEKKTE